MRIPIREQLTGIILLTSLICLGVVSIATWVTERNFTLGIRSSRLSLTASLKAAQLTSNLNLMETSVNFVTTRVLIQHALARYNANGNNTAANWASSQADLEAAIGGGGSVGAAILLQAMVFGKSGSGPGGSSGLLNVSSSTANNTLKLPYKCPDGGDVYLGDGNCDNLGFPPQLYPNLTFSSEPYNSTFNIPTADYDGDTLRRGSSLLIGPWFLNQTFSIVSLTMPIINNTSAVDVLGWLTVLMDATLISSVASSTEGLGDTGESLLVGPASSTNLFPKGILYSMNNGTPPKDFSVQYILPINANASSRHPNRTISSGGASFDASQYPAIAQAFTQSTGQADNSGANLKTTNEAGKQVSVGYASVESRMVNWAILIEQARGEVWEPINRLRSILLACVFGTAGFMVILAFPLAHIFSLPIRRLREATARSIEPPGMSHSRSSLGSFGSLRDGARDPDDPDNTAIARKEGFHKPDRFGGLMFWRKSPTLQEPRSDRRRKQEFRIPSKVRERKSWIKDELSDLTFTFNEMSDELMMQYSKLEERVAQRTAELETSKKAAEAANESKTLFIANISHELKTPLNGILGMCAVCMQEDDPSRLKRSLGIIYKSGDLLLNLLTDLLTFSKNQVGQHLSLDEKEFRLRDVSSQTLAIFDKQAKEGQIDLRVVWEGMNDSSSLEQTAHGPAGFGRVKDMILWGDTHRILQVVINLVSNSLKFTPAGGSVTLTIRCLPDVVSMGGSRAGSMNSRQSRASKQASSRNAGSKTSLTFAKADTPMEGGARERPRTVGKLQMSSSSERTASPPPGKFLLFEFEVHDTGPGIPEELQGKIFEPFVQGDLGLSKKYGGTGLGLSICSQLAGLMRGTVGVKSTLGEGSTFTLRIPIKHLQTHADSSASSTVELLPGEPSRRSESSESRDRLPYRRTTELSQEPDDVNQRSRNISPADPSNSPIVVAADSQPRLVGLSQPFFASSQPMESPGSQPAAMQRIAAEAKRGGRIRVLVAEDNKVNQEVVLRMLKLEDVYDVTVAKDGQEALDLVKESMTAKDGRPFNLIFMDVQMPNVDGLQSTRLIREIGYQAPIVALTAFAEESNIKDCMDSGMNYFLSKPIRRPQLKKVLKEYCAPIPEENEDFTPPAPEAGSSLLPVEPLGNTTIVMVSGSTTQPTPSPVDGSNDADSRTPKRIPNGHNIDTSPNVPG